MQKLEKWDKSRQSLFSWDKASRNQTLRAFSEKNFFLIWIKNVKNNFKWGDIRKSMHHFIKAKSLFLKIYIFPTWIFFTDIQESQSTRGRRYYYILYSISLIPPHHFHQLHRYLDISRTITVDSSPLSSWKHEAK